jgi:hypothetical protein
MRPTLVRSFALFAFFLFSQSASAGTINLSSGTIDFPSVVVGDGAVLLLGDRGFTFDGLAELASSARVRALFLANESLLAAPGACGLHVGRLRRGRCVCVTRALHEVDGVLNHVGEQAQRGKIRVGTVAVVESQSHFPQPKRYRGPDASSRVYAGAAERERESLTAGERR